MVARFIDCKDKRFVLEKCEIYQKNDGNPFFLYTFVFCKPQNYYVTEELQKKETINKCGNTELYYTANGLEASNDLGHEQSIHRG